MARAIAMARVIVMTLWTLAIPVVGTPAALLTTVKQVSRARSAAVQETPALETPVPPSTEPHAARPRA